MATAARGPQPASASITLEEFYEITGDRKAELVDGVIIYDGMILVGPPALLHGSVCVRVSAALAAWVYPRDLGELFDGATGFVLRRHPPLLRCPDVAFVAAGRIPPEDMGKSIELAPDLAVEVLSPSNSAGQMNRKLEDYLVHGTRIVWFVDSETRRVVVHTADQPVQVLRADETIDGGAVLPGFTAPVAAFFAGLKPWGR